MSSFSSPSPSSFPPSFVAPVVSCRTGLALLLRAVILLSFEKLHSQSHTQLRSVGFAPAAATTLAWRAFALACAAAIARLCAGDIERNPGPPKSQSAAAANAADARARRAEARGARQERDRVETAATAERRAADESRAKKQLARLRNAGSPTAFERTCDDDDDSVRRARLAAAEARVEQRSSPQAHRVASSAAAAGAATATAPVAAGRTRGADARREVAAGDAAVSQAAAPAPPARKASARGRYSVVAAAAAAAARRRPSCDAALPAWKSFEALWPAPGSFVFVRENAEATSDAGGKFDSGPRMLAIRLGAPIAKPVVVARDSYPGLAPALFASVDAGDVSTRVLQFTDCVAVTLLGGDTTPTTGDVFTYGTFPLLPDQTNRLPGDTGAFTASYTAIRALSDDQRMAFGIDALLAEFANGGAAAAQPRRGARQPGVSGVKFVPRPLTRDDFDNELKNLGKPCDLYRTEPSTAAARQLFKLQAFHRLQGYSAAPVGSAERTRMLLEFIALPRLIRRKPPPGAVMSQRDRETWERTQLSAAGQWVELTPESAAAATAACKARAAAPERTPHEFVEHCVKQAEALVRDGQLSRAHSALTKVQLDRQPLDKIVAGLRPLHPDGAQPEGMQRPATPVFNVGSIDRSMLLRMCGSGRTGSAPGPDGWTYELLFCALTYEGVMAEFTAVLVDLLNGDVAPEVAAALRASWLVGIPKPNGGTRPLALGSVIQKLAVSYAVERCSKRLAEKFRGSQFGVSTPRGTEIVVHVLRRFVRDGVFPPGFTPPPKYDMRKRVVVTIDCANAFNELARQAMWDAVKEFPELVGSFLVSYGDPGDLFVVGSDGKVTLKSLKGARQGTTDGPVVFALALQKFVLARLAKLDRVASLFYLDDGTFLCADLEAAEEAVREFVTLAREIGLVINPSKCELLFPDASAKKPRIAPGSPLTGFVEKNAIKVLGANIAVDDASERAALTARLTDTAALVHARVVDYPSPQLMAIVRRCMMPQLGYAASVHSPAVSVDALRTFDARSADIARRWACTHPLTEGQLAIWQQPERNGGLGMTSLEATAHALYLASFSYAFSASVA